MEDKGRGGQGGGQGGGQVASRSTAPAAPPESRDIRIAPWLELIGVRRELDSEYRAVHGEMHQMPTGVITGLDADLTYYWFQVGAAFGLALFSFAGTLLAFHGGGAAVVAKYQGAWSDSPTQVITTVLLSAPSIIAIIVQAVLFVIQVGNRHTNAVARLAATVVSAVLTYLGWSGLVVPAGAAVLTGLSTVIPAAILSGVLTWAVLVGMVAPRPARGPLIGLVSLGAFLGLLGLPVMLQWLLALVAFTGDQFARRKVILG